jgi:hypothetical protein
MAAKPLKAGAEIDAWCTKCRMDLLHRVIAMHGDKIERVECRTCGGHHAYRRPKSAPAERAGAGARSAAGPSSARRPATSSAKAAAAAEAERSRTVTWEKAVAGRAYTDFRPYRPTETFEQGELLRHAKFGDGYVARVVDRQKVEVMFRDGPRTLAQSLGA